MICYSDYLSNYSAYDGLFSEGNMAKNIRKQGFELGKHDRKRDDMYLAAVEYINQEYCSVEFALQTGQFPLCEKRQLFRFLKNPELIGRNKQHVLTKEEREDLVTWMLESNAGSKSVDRESSSARIVQVLKDRQHRNRQSKGLKYDQLSACAKQCLDNNGPSRKFSSIFSGIILTRLARRSRLPWRKNGSHSTLRRQWRSIFLHRVRGCRIH